MTAAFTSLTRWMGRWIGPAGIIAAVVFLAGRIALEPCRKLPHFDDGGMEAYSAVETFNLKKMPQPFEVGLFGSSVAVWGLMPEVIAEQMGRPPEQLRKLCVQGGTTFDMRNLIREQGARFREMKVALVEINPRLLYAGLEGDERMEFDLWQHASLRERLMLGQPEVRRLQVAEWLLPLGSTRRPLGTAYLNLLDPDPGAPIAPYIDSRLRPFGDWNVADPARARFSLKKRITPDEVARRIAMRWRPSALLDHCLREFIDLVEARGATLILHEMPVHPAVMERMLNVPEYRRGLDDFEAYIGSLGIPETHIVRVGSIAELGIPENGMRDHTHMNEIGARIYSQHLGKETARILGSKKGSGTSAP